MEFPPDWLVEPLDDFDLAVATLANSGDAIAIQLLAQLRPTGRVLDNFRLAINSSEILDVELNLHHLLPVEAVKGYRLNFQHWPRDIGIRRNLTTSGWLDVPDLVASNNATVHDADGAGIPSGEFRRLLDELPDNGPETCAIRWAVAVGEDGLLKLQVQSLPGDAASLNGKPLTKG
jgi:hypothetical protein